MSNDLENESIKIIRLPKVIDTCGLSRSSIYEKINPKSRRYDPTFPTPIKIGVSAVGWLRHEIEAWILSKKA